MKVNYIPQYLNKPLQYIGLELTEIMYAYMGLYYAFIVKSTLVAVIWAGLMIWFVKYSRSSPPGFMKHALYTFSMFELEYYPDAQRQFFIE